MLKKVTSNKTETFYTCSLSLEYLDQHFRQDWEHLATRCLEPNIFYTASFLMALRHHLMQNKNIVVLTSWRQAERKLPELIGVFPMVECRFLWGRPVKILQALTHPFIPSTTPLLHQDYSEQAIIHLLDFLEEQKEQYNAVNMPFLPVEGEIYNQLQTELTFRERSLTTLSSYQRAALFSPLDPADYLKTMHKSRRKDIQRRGRKLAQTGKISYLCYREPEELDKALSLFLDLEASGWKGKKGTAMKSNLNTTSFAKEALRVHKNTQRTQYDFLTIDDTIIAGAITLIHNDKVWSYKSAYDENYAQYAPSLQADMQLTKDLLSDKTISISDSAAVSGHVIEGLWRQHCTISNILFPTADHVSANHIKSLAAAHHYYSLTRETVKGWVNKLKG